jgi:hypothetical protein
LIALIFKRSDEEDSSEESSEEQTEFPEAFLNKISKPGYKTTMNIIHAGEDAVEAKSAIREIASTLHIFSNFGQNSFKLL